MDIDPTGFQTPDQMSIWREDLAQNLVQPRSYRCTFCKRGFSNAQALGGHMNIHRKDRAKLKEFSGENLLSLDITKATDCEDSPPSDSCASEELSMESDQTKRQWLDGKADDEIQAGSHDTVSLDKENLVRRLPLFAEAPSVNGGGDHDQEEAAGSLFGKHIVEKRKVELTRYGELDLELRLGPEPHDAKSNHSQP